MAKAVYELARQGKCSEDNEPRKIVIKEFEINENRNARCVFSCCMQLPVLISGVFANDFGEALGCVGGYLSSLCRTRIGDSKLDDAKTMAEWENEIKTSEVQMDS